MHAECTKLMESGVILHDYPPPVKFDAIFTDNVNLLVDVDRKCHKCSIFFRDPMSYVILWTYTGPPVCLMLPTVCPPPSLLYMFYCYSVCFSPQTYSRL